MYLTNIKISAILEQTIEHIEKIKKMTASQKPTIKVIAERAGVSVTTVSRVLSGQGKKYRISSKTEDLVTRLTNELNYEPNILARSLRTKQTFTIGMIVPDISNPFFASIARYVETESRKAGYSVILCDSQEDTILERESIKVLRMRKVDGMIICPVGKELKHILDVSKANRPVIIVDRYFPTLDLSCVLSDNYNGAMNAMNHFIEKGHRKIAFIQGLSNTSVNEERLKGYFDAHEKNNIPINESFIVGEDFGEENGYIGAKILLNGSERPTAILGGSNLISLGALRAISEEHLSIPDDISLIAFDDQPYYDYLSSPITSIRQKKEELGKISIALLLSELNGNNLPGKKKIIVPTELIVRRSVKQLN